MDCHKWDEQVVRLEQIADVSRDFVLVRLVRIMGADLNLFEFDYDTTWSAFFLDADEHVYGRYGGRDAAGPDQRMSLAGLKFAMNAALAAYRKNTDIQAPRVAKPQRVEDYPNNRHTRGCIHCHQVAEIQRDLARSTGHWTRADLWVYPLPENVGLTLEVDRGNRVKSVKPNSPAARSGIQASDTLTTLNGYSVASFADAQFALHKAPVKGTIPITWERAGQPLAGQFEVIDGWRRTDLTWRPSMLDLLPSLCVYGDDLTDDEKKFLGLDAKRLAFRQDATVHRDARIAGVKPGDVIIGLDNLALRMTVSEFLAHVRRNYLVGDKVTLNVLRAGHRLDLPLTLK